MKHVVQFGLAAGTLFFSSFLSAPAQAQHIGASVARPMAAPRAGYSLRRSRPALASAPRHANYAPFSPGNYGTGGTLQQFLDPVPPPGFDYQYLSAIDSDLAVKAFIDPATQLRIAAARRFLRGSGFGAGGYYILDGGGYYYPDDSEQAEAPQQPAPQQQPQVIVLQEPPATQQAAAQPAPEAAPEAPLPDVGQFVLVLRNGTRIEAVAFTSANGNIVYITADGSRRTIALADLDAGTTVRVNEERGTPLQLPL
ncbi:MAG TPA: hypothetical protein VMD78_01405 [Candidatus Baltobacteraceae bacterium]|nr:hypothetical protein [Candidatus Baltobacteraceae bacterium]